MIQSILLLAIVIGLYYGMFWLPKDISANRSLFKTLPVALMAIAAALSGGTYFLLFALILSAMGDAFLSHDGEKMFLAGLVSFLSAHVAYIALFLDNPGINPVSTTTLIIINTIALIAIGLVLRNLWPHLSQMKLPVVCYTLIIATMNYAAWASGQQALLLIGVGLFVFSDIVLAHYLFYWTNPKTKKAASYTVWYSYLFAQAIIVFTML